ncbi:glycosyltransferase family 2 protein [Sphingobacterium hungaricum]|uniref:Glycosyl transferase family A n=1 Tax=Sphingobacterium hungaricum TaxID=2082723 RepID=A0A928UW24_9SPHI|nr:glycosyltransferase family 2 protein [Sphingobacterium hungaricum]MBE8712355.1 glycosyl transferase family A [Sphingobacterium hungaricum]
MLEPLVSIIIPVYGVEYFVSKCIESLMKQSYSNIEYIIVDDASNDDSMKITSDMIQQYPHRTNMVTFVHHEKNEGLPAARNTGLNVAKGDYIFHCDSDDWVEPEMVEDMVRVAVEDKADIVYTDWLLTFKKNERYMVQPESNSAKNCVRLMLNGSLRFNVWNKLIKRQLYQQFNILFPSGYAMGEDMTIIKLFCHANRISYIPKAYYHYQQLNPNAYTKQVSETKLAQVKFNAAKTIEYIEEKYGYEIFRNELNYFKLNIKLPFLIGADKKMYKLWRKWYPESNAFISGNPAFSRRIKIIQYAAINNQDWLIKLHFYLVTRLVYGLIYK